VPRPQLVDTGELAKELGKLAKEPALALRKDELRCLAEDLKDGRDLAQWAEVDLLDSFARPESLAPPDARIGAMRRVGRFFRNRPWQKPGDLAKRLGRGMKRRAVREDLLEAALGVLVFVPLLITWFGLWEASQAYNELSEEEPRQATRPFLQLWQSGFNGRVSGIGRFDSVALMAVLVISAIVLTAVWHAWARARTDRERDHLLGRLVAVLTRTQLALSVELAASPRRFTGELSKAAKRLESLVRQADNGQQELAKAATAVHDATSAIQGASQRLTDATNPLGSATDRLEAVMRAGQEETARVGRANADEMRAVGDRVGEMGRQIEAVVKELTIVQRELLDSTQAVVSATDQASQAMVASSAKTDEAVRRMGQSADGWDVAAAHWQDAAHRLEAAIRMLPGAQQPRWGPAPDPMAPPRGVG
jgi:hypothetical protein